MVDSKRAMTALGLAAGAYYLSQSGSAEPEPEPDPELETTLASGTASLTNATLETQHSGYNSQAGYINFADANSSATWQFNSPVSGTIGLWVHAANGSGIARTGTVTVNGESKPIHSPATQGWDSWTEAGVPITVAEGSNTLTIATDGFDFGNVDQLRLSSTDVPDPQPEPAPSAPFTWEQTHTDTSWVDDGMNVEVVTSADAGELESACSSNSPTLVVFEAGGTFDGGVRVTGDNTWIAGETAPDPGVVCTGGRFQVEADNVIVSHVGSYYGPVGAEEAMRFDGDNIIFDHCTAAWAVDEVAGASDPHSRVSWIHCIVTEGLYDSVHPEGHHSRGYFHNDGGCRDICFMGGIMANCNRRMPWASGDMACINTYVYNWGQVAMKTEGRGNYQDFIGCMYEPGPNSDSVPIFGAAEDGDPLYVEDVDTSGLPVNNGFDLVNAPLNPPPGLDLTNSVLPSGEVKQYCLANAGMRPAARHSVDQGIISRIGGSAGGFVDDPDQVGGMPNYGQSTHALSVPSTGLYDWVMGHRDSVEP